MKIEDAIQQRHFRDVYHKAHLNILYTAAFLHQQVAQLLKPYGISWQQFNVLRILRGLKDQPATIKLLTERMIDKTSNTSRLVDKLLAKNLVERRECPADRRQVDIFITTTGLQLLLETSHLIDEESHSIWADISTTEADLLNEVLDRVRRK